MKKILVVEDDSHLRDSIATALSSENYEVFEAGNGKSGYEKAISERPDLILCDIMMPEYDGYWLLEKLRGNSELLSTPFIFISAKAERDDMRKGMNLGADDYLTKPFRVVELLDAVAARLSRQSELREPVEIYAQKEKAETIDYIVIDTGRKLEKIKISEIEVVAAENVYSAVHLISGKNVIVRKTLNAWESLLPEKCFVRIHRSVIVNLDYVKQIEKWFNQTLQIKMQYYSKPLIASRGYYKKMKDKFIF